MKRTDNRCFGIARLIAITVALLLASFSVSAAGFNAPASAASSRGVWDDHHVIVATDTLERHGSPAEEPLHCHMRSPHPLAIGPAQSTVKDDLPVPAWHGISAPTRDARPQLPAILARIPTPAPPRFILFGNIRS